VKILSHLLLFDLLPIIVHFQKKKNQFKDLKKEKEKGKEKRKKKKKRKKREKSQHFFEN